ncbi:MAG: C-terminal target protein [Verrucomicrobiales bacterium]|nr:C-terminal target protein [Verrucomicrobiales bacterium]
MNLRILARISTLVVSCFVSTMVSAQTPAALSCVDDFENGLNASQWTTISDGSVQIHPSWTDSYSGNAALTYLFTHESVATTRPINTLGGARISFAIDIRQVVAGPRVVFEYSADNGQSWTTITSFDYNGTWVNPWTNVDMDAPAGARSAATLFRWRQADSAGQQAGAWSLDRVRITTSANSGPSIVLAPHDRVTYPGSIVTLQSFAVGSGLLSYQWRKDGVPISGASDPNLIIYNAQTNQAGAYSVVVSNQFWAITSSVAQVSFTTFGFRPRVLAGPGSDYGQDLFVGQPSVADSGAFAQVNQVSGLPSAEELATYDVVVVTELGDNWWDSPFGDLLADYVDDGGGVVESLYAYSAAYGPLLDFGRLSSGGYLPLTMARVADVPSPQLTMVTDQPSHPIMNGVGTVTSGDGGNWGPTTAVTTGSTRISHWSSGVPMIATKTNHAGRVAGFNGWFGGTPTRLVDNMIFWAAKTPAPEPNIVQQPSTLFATPGKLSTFTAYVAGAAPMGFQWMRNGTVISGALDSAYVIPNPQLGDDATYSYVATNAFGTVTSGTAVLTVETAPQIIAQPQAATITGGNTASMSVAATGTPLAYQWRKNGSALLNETGASLSIANAGISDDADYSVVIKNDVGSVTSSSVHLTVLGPPQFLSQPVSQTTTTGGAVSFSCAVDNGGTLPAVSSGELQLWLDASADVMTDADGFVYAWMDSSPNHANAIQSDVNLQPLLTTSQELNGRRAIHFDNYFAVKSTLHCPTDVGIDNACTIFTVSSSESTAGFQGLFLGEGNGPSVYIGDGQFIDNSYGEQGFSGLNIPSNSWQILTTRCDTNTTTIDFFETTATSSTNTTASTPTSGIAMHTTSYTIGGFSGYIAEEIVYRGKLSDADRAKIDDYLKQKYFGACTASGVTYQWRLNGINIDAATNCSLPLTSVSSSQAGTYTVVVGNAHGTATSVGAVLTVNGPGAPAITSGPQSQSTHFGDSVSLSVSASGNAPLHYQWTKDGGVLNGATDSQLTIDNFSADDGGNYAVTVGNNAGTVSSSPAAVGVPPSIIVQPQGVVVTEGQPFQMAVQATGTPLSYQWYTSGWTALYSPIRRDTSAVLAREHCTTSMQGRYSDVGNYFVVVSNAYGCVTSSVVNVTIATQPAIYQQPEAAAVREGDWVEFGTFCGGSALNAQWYHNGNSIPGANDWSSFYIGYTKLSDAGTYYLVVSNSVGKATSKKVTLTVSPTPPRITITSPSKNLTVSDTSVHVYGTCNPMNAWEVDISVNNGPRRQVVQGEVSSWDAGYVDLNLGANKIVATLVWYFGDYEFSVTNTVICAPTATLQGGIIGSGTVTPNLFGQTLTGGKTYHMTAVPAANSVFVGWSSTNGAAIISTNPSLTFVMSQNTYLRAIFEPDPFLPIAGNFNGLFSDTTVSPQSAGSVTLKLVKKGAYSGTLKRAGATYPISGKFDLSGNASSTVSALGGAVNMQLDFNKGTVTGSVQTGGWNSSLRAVRAPYTTLNHSPWSGKYTMVLPATAPIASANGFAIINHLPTGTINLTPPSTLADGVAVSQSVGVCANGEWPVYIPINGGNGVLFGWLNFSNAPSTTLGGNLSWLRTASLGADMTVNASRYVPGAANFGLSKSTISASCEGGALKNCVSNVVSLAKNPVAVQSPNTNNLAITVTPANGYFSGNFVYGGALKKIKGVLLQQQTNGAGLFLDAPQNGAVSLK